MYNKLVSLLEEKEKLLDRFFDAHKFAAGVYFK